MPHLGNQCDDDAVAVLATDLDQHDEARAAFDQSGDMAVSCTTQQITFPVARNGTILDLGRSVPDRYSIDDLLPRLARRCRGSAPVA